MDLGRTKLFAGIGEEETEKLLCCLCAKQVHYQKGSFILEEGAVTEGFGILLSGRGRAVKWEASGRVILLSLLEVGSEIGVILAASQGHKSPVTVEALEDCCVLEIPFGRILSRCEQDCPCHGRFLGNYIGIVAEKGLLLHERIDCLLRPTVREKILAYLGRLAGVEEMITIPLSRGGMAEYLNVERSALSRELSRMKKEGILQYRKNVFVLRVDD